MDPSHNTSPYRDADRSSIYLLGGLIAIAVLLAAGYKIYSLRPEFIIQNHGKDIRVTGKFPANLHWLAKEFFSKDCPFPGPWSVRGYWRKGRIKITATGNAKPYEQRIRNFLNEHIKR